MGRMAWSPQSAYIEFWQEGDFLKWDTNWYAGLLYQGDAGSIIKHYYPSSLGASLADYNELSKFIMDKVARLRPAVYIDGVGGWHTSNNYCYVSLPADLTCMIFCGARIGNILLKSPFYEGLFRYLCQSNTFSMKKTFYFIGILMLLLSGCEKNPELPPQGIHQNREHLKDTNHVHAGVVHIKVTDRLAEQITDSYSPAEHLFAGMDIESVSRSFPYAGKYEARTRAAGLHLWYTVTFDKDRPLTKTAVGLSDMEGVEFVEYVPEIKLQETSAGFFPFNDPFFSKQWHLYNDGSLSNEFIAGADINVTDVWKYYTTGSNRVVVAIVDTGVDISTPIW